MQGPAPLPTAIKELRGNPGKRPLNDREPKPGQLVAIGDPPEFLGEYGQAEWHRVGPVLIALGLLTEADLMTFVNYCMNVDILMMAQRDIETHGMTIYGARGTVKNPALTSFASASNALRQLAAEFGMTPSSRSRMKLPGDDGQSLDDLLADDGTEDAA